MRSWIAQGHAPNGDPYPRWANPTLGAAGALESNAEDMLRFDLERALLTVRTSIAVLPKHAPQQIPTKNRRVRTVAVDELTLAILRAQIEMLDSLVALHRHGGDVGSARLAAVERRADG